MPKGENFVPAKQMREAVTSAHQALLFCKGYFDGRDVQAPDALEDALARTSAVLNAKYVKPADPRQLDLTTAEA